MGVDLGQGENVVLAERRGKGLELERLSGLSLKLNGLRVAIES